MSEDFGWAGDESFLDAENFALEQNELRAMQYEEQQRFLREQEEEEEEGCLNCSTCSRQMYCYGL